MSELFAGVPVASLDRALPWWERLMGQAADFLPNDSEAVWRVGGGWVYVVVDAERAGKGLVTVMLEDLDSQLAELADRGLETEPIETFAGKARKATLADPDGNRVSFGEALSEDSGDGA